MAQKATNRASAIDDRASRSWHCRRTSCKRIDETAWIKTIAGLHKTNTARMIASRRVRSAGDGWSDAGSAQLLGFDDRTMMSEACQDCEAQCATGMAINCAADLENANSRDVSCPQVGDEVLCVCRNLCPRQARRRAPGERRTITLMGSRSASPRWGCADRIQRRGRLFSYVDMEAGTGHTPAGNYGPCVPRSSLSRSTGSCAASGRGRSSLSRLTPENTFYRRLAIGKRARRRSRSERNPDCQLEIENR